MYMAGDKEKVRIVDHRLTQAGSGTWGLAVRYASETKGEIVGTIWLTPKNGGAIRNFVRVVGLDPDKVSIEQLDPNHPEGLSVLDREVEINVEAEEYKGETRLKVNQFIRKPCAPLSDPQTKKEFAAINAAMRAAKKRDDAIEGDDDLGENLMTEEERRVEAVKNMVAPAGGKKPNPLE
jgi:hypothetical protein